MKTQPTIYDVAKAAGVSIATVSRVLNTPHRVNEKTRSAVMSAIDKLSFVPKAEARARAMQNAGRIGVITPFFTSPAFVQRLRGVANALRDTNYELVIYTVDTLAHLKGYLFSLPLTRNVDGLIIMSIHFEDELAKHLVDNHMETVLIEYPQDKLSTIEIDDIAGGKMVAEYLLRKGHTRCAFLGDINKPEYGISPITLRLAGFRAGLEQAGFSLPIEYTLQVPYDMEATRQYCRDMLKMAEPPSAIFAATDVQAMGLLKAARELGLRVPQDLAVVGFDDLDMADYIGLTTVRQNLCEAGRIAVELLLSRMADPSRPLQHVHLPLSIVERETV